MDSPQRRPWKAGQTHTDKASLRAEHQPRIHGFLTTPSTATQDAPCTAPSVSIPSSGQAPDLPSSIEKADLGEDVTSLPNSRSSRRGQRVAVFSHLFLLGFHGGVSISWVLHIYQIAALRNPLSLADAWHLLSFLWCLYRAHSRPSSSSPLSPALLRSAARHPLVLAERIFVVEDVLVLSVPSPHGVIRRLTHFTVRRPCDVGRHNPSCHRSLGVLQTILVLETGDTPECRYSVIQHPL